MNEQEETKIITRKEAKENGLKRYFTGKPCNRGHVAERQTGNRECFECAKARRDTQYSKEYLKSWRRTDRGRASVKKYNTSEKAKEKARQRYQRPEVKDRVLKSCKKYRESEKGMETIFKRNSSQYYKELKEDRRLSGRLKKAADKYVKSKKGTKSFLKKTLGFEPPEELVTATHVNRQIKRLIKQQKQKQ